MGQFCSYSSNSYILRSWAYVWLGEASARDFRSAFLLAKLDTLNINFASYLEVARKVCVGSGG